MKNHGLAITAVRAAARVRADAGIGPASPLCPYDVAEQLGISVRLVEVPSLEGMYSPDPHPTILVSTERPAGRRRFTCGHEIGHHVFEHGTRLDHLTAEEAKGLSPEEIIAQRFAAALLMPNLAIDSAFARRGHTAASAPAAVIFTIAQELGVGYTTLLGHLEKTISRISASRANTLRRIRLPALRAEIAGSPIEHDLIVVDEHWQRATIDLEVGDVVQLPTGARFTGECTTALAESERQLLATQAGLGELLLADTKQPIGIRVSRRRFAGLARYRNLEDTDDE